MIQELSTFTPLPDDLYPTLSVIPVWDCPIAWLLDIHGIPREEQWWVWAMLGRVVAGEQDVKYPTRVLVVGPPDSGKTTLSWKVQACLSPPEFVTRVAPSLQFWQSGTPRSKTWFVDTTGQKSPVYVPDPDHPLKPGMEIIQTPDGSEMPSVGADTFLVHLSKVIPGEKRRSGPS